ncbi:MAG: hypothetical protein BroJett030_02150 [Alphaproteobacteria bacterium]|nr:MAG: hypothetical protein BroJett030_02150 [Alphaproteobacteria bacterium]
MSTLALVLFATACGFTTAGLLSSVHRLALGEAETRPVGLSFASPPAMAWSLLICALAGPYLALALAWPSWRRGDLAGRHLLALAAVCAVWSFCSGVFVIEAGLMIGHLVA